MTVSLWVKINNAAYYAGTHTKPTLTINYDNGTTITSVATASTSWQLLACTFTPATGYGQIEMKVTGATDATGTNRYEGAIADIIDNSFHLFALTVAAGPAPTVHCTECKSYVKLLICPHSLPRPPFCVICFQ